MHSNLGSCQFKIECCKLFYTSLIGTMKQKLIIDTQKRKRKNSKHITTEKSSNHNRRE